MWHLLRQLNQIHTENTRSTPGVVHIFENTRPKRHSAPNPARERVGERAARKWRFLWCKWASVTYCLSLRIPSSNRNRNENHFFANKNGIYPFVESESPGTGRALRERYILP